MPVFTRGQLHGGPPLAPELADGEEKRMKAEAADLKERKEAYWKEWRRIFDEQDAKWREEVAKADAEGRRRPDPPDFASLQVPEAKKRFGIDDAGGGRRRGRKSRFTRRGRKSRSTRRR